MNPTMKKVYTVSKKADKPRVWLQSLVCEAAGWSEGDTPHIQVNENNQEIVIQNAPIEGIESHLIHVSGRKNPTSNSRRPLVDSAGERYASILSIKQKIEITVYTDPMHKQGRVVIRPLHYSLMETKTVKRQVDERLRLLSLCAGSGIGTACLTDTNYFTPVMEVEFDDDSSEVLKHNYPNSFLFNGDLRDCNEAIESDMAFVTLPCNDHSSLGYNEQNIMNNLVIGAAKILKSSKPKAILFENVPGFYKSESWVLLKELLADDFKYWQEKNIQSWDFGSIATRNRTYAVAFNDYDLFQNFQFPAAPNGRRRKLKDFLDSSKSQFEWKSLEKWKTSFATREAYKDRSLDKTFVSGNVKQINAIVARYRSHSASNTYVLREDGEAFRFLTESEIRRILRVPDWFEFCDHTPITRRYEMLGQSVDGNVIRAIGNKIAAAFMKYTYKTKHTAEAIKEKAVQTAVNISSNGQLELVI